MKALKASNPDKFAPILYKNLSNMVSMDVIIAIQYFFTPFILTIMWNHTFISLLPKVSNPMGVNDIRPISLCNVIYKIISRILVKRLRSILQSHIFPFQWAFILGDR